MIRQFFAHSVLVALLIFAGSLARSNQSCQNLFHNIEIESVDTEYKTAKGERNYYNVESERKYHQVIHNLLKKTLYPMAERVAEMSKKTTKTKVKQLLKNNPMLLSPNESPIVLQELQRSSYIDMKPKSEWVDQRLESQINRSAAQSGNASYYGFWNRSGIAIHESKKVLWIEPSKKVSDELGWVHQMFSTTMTPVGAYGESFSKKLLATTAIMMELAQTDPTLRALSQEAIRTNPELLKDEAARVKHSQSEGAIAELTPLSGLVEGILSLHQFITATLGEKIPGAETGTAALREIVLNGSDKKLGLTAEFASRLTMGIIGPVTMTGQHFKQPYVRNADGTLSFSQTLKTTLQDMAMGLLKSGKKGRCPMSGLFERAGLKSSTQAPAGHAKPSQQQPGLQLIAEAYLRIFEKVDQLNP